MPAPLDNACRICGNTHGHRLFYPREMLFGTGEVFEYLECGYCGCLQITEVPADLARHYPASQYYSYSPPRLKKYPAWMMALRKLRSRAFLGEPTLAGKLIASLSNENEHFAWIRDAGGNLDWRILDVGCGAGKLILQMQRDGFRDVTGLDAFIERDLDYGNGVRIHKRQLHELDGIYDFIMLHHSFEHMPDPRGSLRDLRRLVAPDGSVLIRVPLADSYARRRYGVHWLQWDAPRHLFLHTVKSLYVLAEQTGFTIAKVIYDSWNIQFGGEGYIRQGLAGEANTNAGFVPEEKVALQQFVRQLNTLRDGDQAAFYLRPIS
jgi:SAM-dependent methyltransferase